MKFTVVLLSLLFAHSVWALNPQHRQAISAKRGVHQDWRTRAFSAATRVHPQPAISSPVNRQFAIDVATLIEEADLSAVTPMADYKTIQSYFEKIRDARFIEDPQENILRRITWLYPDDGCFARASMINEQLEAQGQATLSKLYVFGNLEAQSPNAVDGSVEWWYHVAATATDGKNIYVLDPSVEPMRPLLIKEWLGRLGQDPFKSISVCHPDTYTPYSHCYKPSTAEKTTALEDEIYFLPYEKSRLEWLGRDWKSELGDNPPWSKNYPGVQ